MSDFFYKFMQNVDIWADRNARKAWAAVAAIVLVWGGLWGFAGYALGGWLQ